MVEKIKKVLNCAADVIFICLCIGVFLGLIWIIFFPPQWYVNHERERQVLCEDTCVITEAKVIREKERLAYVIYFKRQSCDYEHRMQLRNCSVFNMVAVGDTVSIYGKDELSWLRDANMLRWDNYHFCESCAEGRQRDLWRAANKNNN